MSEPIDERNDEPEQRAGEAGARQAAAESGDDDVAAERDRLREQLQRTMADLQNIRRRHLREMEEARHTAIEALAAELLPVLDNFQLALAAHEAGESAAQRSDTDAMIEGLRMVRSLLQGALERHGLAEIPSLGQPFDPNVHDAVGMEKTAALAPGTVSRVVQQGYTLGSRVIRPAKVMVAERDGESDSERE